MPSDYTDYLTSYHVHSTFSDGDSPIVDYVLAAADMRLDEVGISDHYVLFPDHRQLSWNMPVDSLDEYVEAVQTAAGEAPEDLIVRLGVEADYIPETTDELRDIFLYQPFDYIIGSVHFVDGFAVDGYPEAWEALTQDERNDIIRGYWVRVTEMVRTGLYDIAGHLDLTKKFAFYASTDLSHEITVALDAISEFGMTVELNTSGWHVPALEQYPSVDILRGCLDRGIPVMVNADAHSPANLTRSFDDAYALLRGLGFTEVAAYAGRMRFMRPI